MKWVTYMIYLGIYMEIDKVNYLIPKLLVNPGCGDQLLMGGWSASDSACVIQGLYNDIDKLNYLSYW